jgi:pSer/pThr/pTyr-binding forkhead associated (FHA) protein
MSYVELRWYDPNEGRQVEYAGNLPITPGRSSDNTIVLNSVRVSRNHARIEELGERIILTDLDSSNGMMFQGKRIKGEEVELGDGGHFVIDPFEFSIKVLQVSQPASPG